MEYYQLRKKRDLTLNQGIKSCDAPKGKVLELTITDVDLLELNPLVVSDLQQLILNHVTRTTSSVNIIQKHISPGGALREVYAYQCEDTELLFPIVFGSSLLNTAVLIVNRHRLHINYSAVNILIMNNSNLEFLTLGFPPKLPAHTVCHSTSLDFLAELLDMFISSKQALFRILKFHTNQVNLMFSFILRRLMLVTTKQRQNSQ